MEQNLNKTQTASTRTAESRQVEFLVIPKLVLYHGSNKLFKYLRPESFLTKDPRQAATFAEIKNGGIVYEFEVAENEVYRDIATPQFEWYLSTKKLKPKNQFSV